MRASLVHRQLGMTLEQIMLNDVQLDDSLTSCRPTRPLQEGVAPMRGACVCSIAPEFTCKNVESYGSF